MKYFFIPGRKWVLSLAELKSVLNSSQTKHVELSSSPEYITFDIMLSIDDMLDLFKKLGGFIKFGFVVEDPYEFLEGNVLDKVQKINKKLNFAVSMAGEPQMVREKINSKQKLGMEIKKWLKTKKISSRYVAKPRIAQTSSVLIEKNKILDEGFELYLLFDSKRVTNLWGFTLAVQDYEDFAKRDYKRPRTNKKKGMLPPKLARIMVNLSGLKPGLTIWDPFCGSGTVLQEALVLGYKVIGTDIDSVSIEETQENLSWTCEEYKISHNNYKVMRHDIKDGIPEDIDYQSIVTEPYLGPILRNKVTLKEISDITAELEPIYNAITRISQLDTEKKQSKKLVLVVPGFKTDQDWIDMEMPFVAKSNLRDVTQELSVQPLQWDRPHSIIRRNIKIFEY
ncbi:hypothetical protein JW710_01305 [Candidatus Dojkabacteria bacterium]|nr:hypothetical protein [Candidatus Dojkabacteria bacterium]